MSLWFPINVTRIKYVELRNGGRRRILSASALSPGQQYLFAAGVRAAAFRLLPPPANANNLSASARSPNATVYSHETKRTTQCVAQYAHDGDGSQLRHTPFQLCHIATSIKFDFFVVCSGLLFFICFKVLGESRTISDAKLAAASPELQW